MMSIQARKIGKSLESWSIFKSSYSHAISTNVCNQGGGVAAPWICDFPTEYLCKIVHGYVFGVKETNGDS